MNTCEMCGISEAAIDSRLPIDNVVHEGLIPVLIDHNMETYLCSPCIQDLREECDVEILTESL